MKLRDVVVYSDITLRIREDRKRQWDVGAILLAAMRKSPWTRLFSFIILVNAFLKPFLVLVAAVSFTVLIVSDLRETCSSKPIICAVMPKPGEPMDGDIDIQ